MLAQNVLEVLPETVSVIGGLSEGPEYLGVNYAAILPLLLEALKALEQKCKSCEYNVQEIEGKLSCIQCLIYYFCCPTFRFDSLHFQQTKS